MLRKKPVPMDFDCVLIPVLLIERDRHVAVTVDVIFVSGLSFLVALSHGLTFLSVQYIPLKIKTELANAINQVIPVYNHAGFRPKLSLVHRELEKLNNQR